MIKIGMWTVPGSKEELMKVLNEAKPVGEWVYDHDLAGMRYYRCTKCDDMETLADENEVTWWRFCPRCGAKMFTKTKEELEND